MSIFKKNEKENVNTKSNQKLQNGEMINNDGDSKSIESLAKDVMENKKIYILKLMNSIMNAENMCIYNDSQLMGSLKEYLKAIEPEVERIDDEQWKLAAALNELNTTITEG